MTSATPSTGAKPCNAMVWLYQDDSELSISPIQRAVAQVASRVGLPQCKVRFITDDIDLDLEEPNESRLVALIPNKNHTKMMEDFVKIIGIKAEFFGKIEQLKSNNLDKIRNIFNDFFPKLNIDNSLKADYDKFSQRFQAGVSEDLITQFREFINFTNEHYEIRFTQSILTRRINIIPKKLCCVFVLNRRILSPSKELEGLTSAMKERNISFEVIKPDSKDDVKSNDGNVEMTQSLAGVDLGVDSNEAQTLT